MSKYNDDIDAFAKQVQRIADTFNELQKVINEANGETEEMTDTLKRTMTKRKKPKRTFTVVSRQVGKYSIPNLNRSTIKDRIHKHRMWQYSFAVWAANNLLQDTKKNWRQEDIKLSLFVPESTRVGAASGDTSFMEETMGGKWKVAFGKVKKIDDVEAAGLMIIDHNADIITKYCDAVKTKHVDAISNNINRKRFVFTGKVPGLTRNVINEMIQGYGGVIQSKVSYNTNYLVRFDPNDRTGKVRDAEYNSVAIISVEEFLGLLYNVDPTHVRLDT